MGWAFCGTNRNGVEIGYGVAAVCDEPGCTTLIDRGLAHLCGEMHDDERTCAKYFCGEHLYIYPPRCARCKHIPKEGEENDDDE